MDENTVSMVAILTDACRGVVRRIGRLCALAIAAAALSAVWADYSDALTALIFLGGPALILAAAAIVLPPAAGPDQRIGFARSATIGFAMAMLGGFTLFVLIGVGLMLFAILSASDGHMGVQTVALILSTLAAAGLVARCMAAPGLVLLRPGAFYVQESWFASKGRLLPLTACLIFGWLATYVTAAAAIGAITVLADTAAYWLDGSTWRPFAERLVKTAQVATALVAFGAIMGAISGAAARGLAPFIPNDPAKIA